ncbi:MAG: Hsp70 family protein, partial [Nannocystaceae bacterium]
PDGDLTPWQDVRVPYDPALFGRPLEELPVERVPTGDEIVETYTRSLDGTITVEIDHVAAHKTQRWVLGAMR